MGGFLQSPAARRVLIFCAACLLGGGCDLGTKAWAVETLSELPGRSLATFSPWLEFELSYNRGTAFSFLRDLGGARTAFGVLSLGVAVLLLVLSVKAPSRGDAIAYGTIAGGAVGNGVDRLFRVLPDGGTGVVDFIRINYPWGGSWPNFNVADALLAVGVAVLLLHGLRRAPPPPPVADSNGE